MVSILRYYVDTTNPKPPSPGTDPSLEMKKPKAECGRSRSDVIPRSCRAASMSRQRQKASNYSLARSERAHLFMGGRGSHKPTFLRGRWLPQQYPGRHRRLHSAVLDAARPSATYSSIPRRQWYQSIGGHLYSCNSSSSLSTAFHIVSFCAALVGLSAARCLP